MQKKILLVFLLGGSINFLSAQTKIKDGTVTGSTSLPNSAAVLELESNNKGVLMPRVSLSNTTTWGLAGTSVAGMVVYNTNTGMTGTDIAPILSEGIGFYYWDGARWVGMSAGSNNGDFWRLQGNAGTTPPTTVGTTVGTANYWGTKDAQKLAVGTNSITRAIFDLNGNLFGGNNTVVRGGASNSFLWGENNVDSSSYSILTGANNMVKSSSQGSIVFGTNNIHQGVHSIMGGSDNSSNLAHYSATFGYQNKDSAFHSVVSGQNNVLNANSTASVIHGTSNQLSGAHSLMAGNNNKSYNAHYSFTTGINNIDSSSATSISGENNIIGLGNSHSLISGLQNYITGNGNRNFVLGSYDTVINSFNNLVGGSSNVIIGGGNNFVHGTLNTIANTVATQGYQVVSGTLNKTYDAWKAAVFGSKHIDSAQYSLVSGYQHILTPGMNNATVLGQYNTPMDGALLTVGDGNSVNRSNAFVVTRNSTTSASTNGRIIMAAQLPVYGSDAAADADTSLPSGAFYKLTGSRAINQKP